MSVEDTESYDLDTCLTAGELRESGIEIPENIPDVAWVPKAAIQMKVNEVEATGDEQMNVHVLLTFDEPFKWIKVDVTL